MAALEIVELLRHRIRQPGKRRAQLRHGITGAADDPTPFPRDQGKAAGIDHAAREAHGVAILALRAIGQGDGAEVE